MLSEHKGINSSVTTFKFIGYTPPIAMDYGIQQPKHDIRYIL